MSHKLLRLSSQVFNTPHLITAETLAPITDYFVSRNIGDVKMMEDDDEYVYSDPDEVEVINGTAFIEVEGALTYKPQQGMCTPAGCSYTSLIGKSQYALAMGAKNLVFTYASGGGQALGCFLSANEVRQMADAAGAKIYAYIEEGAHSAAYAWACTADEVIISPDASAGSIGCIIALYDQSKRMSDMGVKQVIISSTPGKSPFAEDGSFSQKFLDKLQEDVTRLGNQFAEHVSKYTGLSVETILALDAQSFHAEKALEIGLVNKIQTPREFLNYLAGV